jgi:ParB family chromosome partitioning protein
MMPRKSAGGAAPDGANGPRRVDLLGRQDRAEATKQKPLPSSTAMRAIADIRIGERIRKDMGDIASLAESIEDLGLINPITVTPDGLLLSGERRLRAAKQLGWKRIPVVIVRLK